MPNPLLTKAFSLLIVAASTAVAASACSSTSTDEPASTAEAISTPVSAAYKTLTFDGKQGGLSLLSSSRFALWSPDGTGTVIQGDYTLRGRDLELRGDTGEVLTLKVDGVAGNARPSAVHMASVLIKEGAELLRNGTVDSCQGKACLHLVGPTPARLIAFGPQDFQEFVCGFYKLVAAGSLATAGSAGEAALGCGGGLVVEFGNGDVGAGGGKFVCLAATLIGGAAALFVAASSSIGASVTCSGDKVGVKAMPMSTEWSEFRRSRAAVKAGVENTMKKRAWWLVYQDGSGAWQPLGFFATQFECLQQKQLWDSHSPDNVHECIPNPG